MEREAYPTDVSDEEWAFVAPYLTLMTEEAPQRKHSLREVFNGLRWMLRAGSAWRMMPHDLPPWAAVYQQSQRWFKAGVFEAIVDDLRALLRLAVGRTEEPSAVIFDSRTLQSTPESGERAGYDGGKRRKGSKVHMAVDTLLTFVRVVRYFCQRARPRSSARVGATGAADYRRVSRGGVCGSRLYG